VNKPLDICAVLTFLFFSPLCFALDGAVNSDFTISVQDNADLPMELLVAPSLAEETPIAVGATDRTEELPIKLYRNYVIVARGSIGNIKDVNFVIDTGAVPSVLDRRIAQRLHLTGSVERLSVFTQDLDTERVMVPDVSLGPFHADSLPAIVGNLSFVEKNLGVRADAVVGLDLLNRSFTIDYRASKLTVGAIDGSFARIPYEADAGYAVVEMMIQRRSLRLMVDTGASDLMLFESGTREYPDAIMRIGIRSGSNMGGEIRLQQVELADASIGSVHWGSRQVFIMPDGGGNRSDGLHGLLGVASLKASRVGFDVEHRILAFDTAEALAPIGPTIRVRVVNYAQAMPSALTGAEREAGVIFGQAGMQIVWVNCRTPLSPIAPADPCLVPLEPNDVVLRILAKQTKSAEKRFEEPIFGFAAAPVLAGVYYEFALDLAKADNTEYELPVILGSVIAHEIGHLLLGPNGHSRFGVMQARWGRKQIGQATIGTLTFSREQAKRMQAELQLRLTRQVACIENCAETTADAHEF
jgi:predicted aspartyl protease